MEGWTRGKKKESAAVKKDPTMEEAEDQALLEELLRIENEARRLDGKIKGDAQGRAMKRSKFDRLVGWGEAVEVSPLNGSIHQEADQEISVLHQDDMVSWSLGVRGAKQMKE